MKSRKPGSSVQISWRRGTRGASRRLLRGMITISVVGLLASVVAAPAHGMSLNDGRPKVSHPLTRVCYVARAPRGVCRAATTVTQAVPAVLIGTSISLLASGAVAAGIPGIKIDAKNGRGWVNAPSGGGTNLVQAFEQDKGLVGPGGWIILDTSLGGVPTDVYRQYVRQIADSTPAGVCLAWVIPHVFYNQQDDAQTIVTAQANAADAAWIRSELANFPCHAFVEWDSSVTTATAHAPNLTAEQQKSFQPLCYDGRHPTALGARVFTARIRQAMAHPIIVTS